MRVIVKRGMGNNLAPELQVNELCCVQSIGVAYGKTYLYDNGYNKRSYEAEIPYTQKVYPTDLVSVHDASLGESFVGRVTEHQITIDFSDDVPVVNSTITIERSEEK